MIFPLLNVPGSAGENCEPECFCLLLQTRFLLNYLKKTGYFSFSFLFWFL